MAAVSQDILQLPVQKWYVSSLRLPAIIAIVS